jgi:hypothetical protein
LSLRLEPQLAAFVAIVGLVARIVRIQCALCPFLLALVSGLHPFKGLLRDSAQVVAKSSFYFMFDPRRLQVLAEELERRGDLGQAGLAADPFVTKNT